MSRKMLLLTLLVSLLATPVLASDLKIVNGWVSEPILDEDPPAYFIIRNSSAEIRTIVGATSPRCESISIRRAALQNGQMGSEAMDGMSIPAGGDVAFVPRGLFLELASPEKLVEGETVPIELEFSNGEKVSFDAMVKND
jgi:copper(I)-binding protein